jgi:hypothetical protein
MIQPRSETGISWMQVLCVNCYTNLVPVSYDNIYVYIDNSCASQNLVTSHFYMKLTFIVCEWGI